MANLISVERVSLALGTAQVLDDLSLGVNGGARIGVVGRNGGGKSTLMRVLAGFQPVDTGRVTRAGDATLGMLAQTDDLDPGATVRQAVLGDLPEHVWAGDARVRDVMSGLLGGVQAEAVGGLEALVGPMSGGERRRLALARLLVANPDVLLLDEPTNHLDVEGVAWLAEHLVHHRAGPDNALVAITHDRWFLDAVATMTWEVTDGRVHDYEGGYAAYVLAKAERERMAAVTAEAASDQRLAVSVRGRAWHSQWRAPVKPPKARAVPADPGGQVVLVGEVPDWQPELGALLAAQGYGAQLVPRLEAAVPLLAGGAAAAVFLAAGPLAASDLLLLRRIRETSPRTAVVVVTKTPSAPDVKRAFESGATSFLSWPASSDAVRQAIDAGAIRASAGSGPQG